ncbi:MAG: flagellar hook capping FlgD N-terminal domain-containing protein, partial [Gammaproteobacteria bacterium]
MSDSVFEQLSFKKEEPQKKNELGKGDFMQLLVAQLKNQ